jgi:hypothetical protein
MHSFNCGKFVWSFFSDEDIDKYTFFESPIPKSFVKGKKHGEKAGVENRDLSFGSLDLNKYIAIDSPTFDVNNCTESGTERTLLHLAVLRDDVSACQQLIGKGMDINAKDKDKRTALHYAIMYFRKEIIELLIHLPDIDLNPLDYLRKTPLNMPFDEENMEPFNKEDYVNIILEMVDLGASLTIRDILERSPIDMITHNGQIETLLLTAILVKQDFKWFAYLPKLKSPLRVVIKLLKHDNPLQSVSYPSGQGLLSPPRPPIESPLTPPPSLAEVGHSDNPNPTPLPVFPSGMLPAVEESSSLSETTDSKRNNLSDIDDVKLADSLNPALPPHFSTAAAALPQSRPLPVAPPSPDRMTNRSCAAPSGDGFGLLHDLKNRDKKESAFYRIIENFLFQQDPQLLMVLIYMYVNLELSAQLHLTESEELHGFAMKAKNMIFDLFRCDAMNFPLNVQKVLQPTTEINRNKPLTLIQARAFEGDNVLAFCMKKHIKFVFSLPEVDEFLDDLFYTSLKKEYLLKMENVGKGKSNNIFFQSNILSFNLRSCPFAIFLLRFISQIILLCLIASIAQDYSHDYQQQYNNNVRRRHWETSEVWLLIFAILELIYEIGQLIEDKFHWRQFFHGTKHMLELFVLALILAWAVLRIRGDLIRSARVVLALSAIPASFSLLRFLALWKPLGELSLCLKWVMKDIFVFACLYIIYIVGFGIAIYSLFSSNALFPTHGLMFVTLFEYTLTNFDFSIFQTDSVVVNTIGVIVLIVFLLMTAIVLFNLLIARLTNVHDRLMDAAVVEWTYIKSDLVGKNVLLREMHPFKIIPPPFNIVTVVLAPVHFLVLRQGGPHRISIAGTVANLEYSFFLGSFIRVYGLLKFYTYGIWMKFRNIRSPWYFLKLVFFVFPVSLLIVIIRIFATFVAPFVQWRHAVERCDENGNFDYLAKADTNTITVERLRQHSTSNAAGVQDEERKEERKEDEYEDGAGEAVMEKKKEMLK